MVKKSNKAATGTNGTTTTTKANISQTIRDYAKAHPGLKPADIAKALTDAGTKCNSARVSGVLRAAEPKIDVQMIKSAAAYAKQFKTKEDAQAAIEKVALFLDVCGSPDKARVAVDSYFDLAGQLN